MFISNFNASDFLGRSLQQIKVDVGEKGDLGIVAEVCFLINIKGNLSNCSENVTNLHI